MREETRKKLERQLWLNRLKWAGTGLVIMAGVGTGLWWTGLDASTEIHKRGGVVTAIGPLSGTSTKAIEDGLAVDVKLDDGRVAHVMALKASSPKVGEHVEISEHVHGTGRVTFTWK